MIQWCPHSLHHTPLWELSERCFRPAECQSAAHFFWAAVARWLLNSSQWAHRRACSLPLSSSLSLPVSLLFFCIEWSISRNVKKQNIAIMSLLLSSVNNPQGDPVLSSVDRPTEVTGPYPQMYRQYDLVSCSNHWATDSQGQRADGVISLTLSPHKDTRQLHLPPWAFSHYETNQK